MKDTNETVYNGMLELILLTVTLKQRCTNEDDMKTQYKNH